MRSAWHDRRLPRRMNPYVGGLRVEQTVAPERRRPIARRRRLHALVDHAATERPDHKNR